MTELKRKGYGASGLLSLGNDGKYLRIRFPKVLWLTNLEHPSPYFYLGLLDSESNREFANTLVEKIWHDIETDNFDPSLGKYQDEVIQHKSFIYPEMKYTKPVVDLVGKVFKDRSLNAVYAQYVEYKKRFIGETTYRNRYQYSLKNAITKCPQNLNDAERIVDHLLEKHTPGIAKTILQLLGNMVEWAQRRKILGYKVPNPYQEYAAEIRVSRGNQKPIMIKELEDEGIIDLSQAKVRSLSAEEAEAVIEAFENWVSRNNHEKTPWDLIVKFLLWTGCRQGECAGLRWLDISADCSRIHFQSSYDERTGLLKGLKTEVNGSESRIFHCGEKLQQLLLEIRPEEPFNKKTYVFGRKGQPPRMSTFSVIWRGKSTERESYPGILPKLIRQGKVHQYVRAYATRHTFINLMIQQGHSFYDIADLVGNSALTIDRHYRDSSRTKITPVEV